MACSSLFQRTYSWTKSPLIVGAPMRLIGLAPLAVAISQAGALIVSQISVARYLIEIAKKSILPSGGLGFIGAGTETRMIKTELERAAAALLSRTGETHIPGALVNVGVGFINWGSDLKNAANVLEKYVPSAVWFFAPRTTEDLRLWANTVRFATGNRSKIWVQIGSVTEARDAVRSARPHVLVVQGADAGGHGRARSAGTISLLPEVADAMAEFGDAAPSLLAAGGIADGRGVAAALALGAQGAAMGTRFLGSEEANVARGYRDEVIRVADGGLSTARTGVYDQLRGTTGWPAGYNARGVLNRSWQDAKSGMAVEENKKLYSEAEKLGDAGWGVEGRMTTYAGTAIGLVKEVQPAAKIVEEVREGAKMVFERLGGTF